MKNRDYASRAEKRTRRSRTLSREREPTGPSSFYFALVAFCCFAFAAGLYYLEGSRNEAQFNRSKQLAATSHGKIQDRGEGAVKIAKRPRFDFYHILPKMEVAVNDLNATNPSKGPSELPKALSPATLMTAANLEPARAQPVSVSSSATVVALADSMRKELQDERLAPTPIPARIVVGRSAVGQYILQLASFQKKPDADRLKSDLLAAGFQVGVETVRLPSGETWHRVKSHSFARLEDAQKLHQQLRAKHIDAIILSLNG